jgi:hypothetical protein
MLKTARLKSVSLILIFSFILFYSPYLLTGQTEQTKSKGDLIGKVYDKDGTTIIEGAIVKIKNVVTGTVYESKTDMLGTFKIEGIEEGMYAVGIVTKEGNFNVEGLIGIRADEKAIVTFALKPYLKGEAKMALVRAKLPKKVKEVPGILKFFSSPIGIATVIAASSAVVYGVVTLTGEEPEVSPFRK